MSLTSALTFVHIGMGSVALIGGAGAMSFRKGSRRHRQSGNVFFVSMLVMAALGATLAAAKPDLGTAIMGAFTFYLVATGWMTVIRPEGTVGGFERLAMLAGAVLALAAFACGIAAVASPKGGLHGYPASFYFIVAGLIAACAAFDRRLVVRRGIAGGKRLARHLGRLGSALFIATGSLFLGQPEVFPEALRWMALRSLPVLLVVGLTIFWLIRVSFTRRGAIQATRDEPGVRQGIGWVRRGRAAGAPAEPAP